MLRSLYSGIGGMNNFQTKLDVIGNNIANVNTFGFKKGRATFNDLVSQQLQGASNAVEGGRGGTNPQQIGLGGGTASIDTISTQGSLQSTSRDLDIALSGDGYFVLNDGEGNVYSRAGNFYLDEEGTLVNANGLRIQGYQLELMDDDEFDNEMGESEFASINSEEDLSDLRIPAGASIGDLILEGFTMSFRNEDGELRFFNNEDIDIEDGDIPADFPGDADDFGEFLSSSLDSFNISQSGEITGVFSDGDVRILGQIAMANFSNPGGLNKSGNNTYEATNNSGEAEIGLSGTGGLGQMIGSALEMSNVDLSEEFAEMIVSQRGFQANTRMITTSDEILQELVNLKR